MSEGRSKSMWNFLKPIVRPIAGRLYYAPKAVATIVYEEDIEPRASSAYIRLGAFWNELQKRFQGRGESLVNFDTEGEEGESSKTIP